MANYIGNFSDQMDHFQHWAIELKTAAQLKFNAGIQRTYTVITGTCSSIQQTFHTMCQKCREIAIKIKAFVLENRAKILFSICAAATAIFSPELFFPSLIISVVFRTQISYHLENQAEYYLKPERNPYLLDPNYGPKYISTFDLLCGTIAGVDALALGTFFTAPTWFVALAPALGGMAVGDVLAKWGMDFARSFEPNQARAVPPRVA